MTRSKGKVSAQAQQIMSGKSMKKATGKKTTKKTTKKTSTKKTTKKKRSPKQGRPGLPMLTPKGQKLANRRKAGVYKGMFKKPGHWTDPDPYRFFGELIDQYMDSCDVVNDEYKYLIDLEKKRNKKKNKK